VPWNDRQQSDGRQVRSGYGDIGARCSFAGGGTATLAGQRLNCGCDNGGYLYGYPNQTAAVWTISYAAPGSGAVSTPITTVYE